MWQMIIVLLIVAGVLIYIVRHYAGILRGETPACSSCPADCPARSGRQAGPEPCCSPPGPTGTEQEGR